MKIIKAQVLTTRHGNLFIKFFNYEICAYADANFTIQRLAAYEEWEKANMRWGSNNCKTTNVPWKTYDQANVLFEEVEDWIEEVSDICKLVGKIYTFLQPNGNVERVIWITGKQWHSYEGAIGYEPILAAYYEFRKFINGQDTPPATRHRRRVPTKK